MTDGQIKFSKIWKAPRKSESQNCINIRDPSAFLAAQNGQVLLFARSKTMTLRRNDTTHKTASDVGISYRANTKKLHV